MTINKFNYVISDETSNGKFFRFRIFLAYHINRFLIPRHLSDYARQQISGITDIYGQQISHE